MLHGFGKRLGRRDDALLEVPESACGTDRDVEDAMACRAIRECAVDELGRVRVDLDPCALRRVDARYVGAGNRAREELLVAPAIRISLFECRGADICRAVGTDLHARVECSKSYLCIRVSKVKLVFRACHHVNDDTCDGHKRHLRAFCVPYVTNLASPNVSLILVCEIDAITR